MGQTVIITKKAEGSQCVSTIGNMVNKSKEQIKDIVIDYLGEENVILIHYCGSAVYNTADDHSDTDIIVITKSKLTWINAIKSDNSYQYIKLENLDVFVIDFENATKIHNLDESTNLYVRVFCDSALTISDSLIYKNKHYQREYNQYVDLKIEDQIVEYYSNVLEYYRKLFYIRFPKDIKKREYHIFRFLNNFDYFVKTGIYLPCANGDYTGAMYEFKTAAERKDASYRQIFETALNELTQKVLDYCLSVSNAERALERMRRKLIKNETGKVYFSISRIGDSKQSHDLSVPANCNGFGRIHHFRKLASPDWLEDFLPAYPAYKALGLPFQEGINAQVFQISVCNLNCWYCFVPEELRCGNDINSKWITTDQLIEMYCDEAEKPKVIDLSGGNPELVPEWVVEMMKSIENKGLADSVYLWSDDSLSTDAFFRYLNPDDIDYLKNYKNYGKVCCFKGFDFESFHFNSSLPRHHFFIQKEMFRRYYQIGLDIYGYITITTNNLENIEKKVSNFMDYLQSINKSLPLRIVPLRIMVFGAMEHRLDDERRQALKNQEVVLCVWKNELERRFTRDQINKRICDVNIYE